MTHLSRPVRLLAAASLLLTAVLSLVSVLLQPEFASDPVELLAGIDAAGGTAVASALAFGLAQLPFLVTVVAVAALAHHGSPRAAWAGGVLAVLGGFGHAVFAGVALTWLALAADADGRAVLAPVVTRVESGPAVVFMAAGLIGTVLGLLVLGIALFRSQVVPRWVPVALWAFLVTEFALTNLTDWAAPLAALLYLAAFVGLAGAFLRPVSPAAPSKLVGDETIAPVGR